MNGDQAPDAAETTDTYPMAPFPGTGSGPRPMRGTFRFREHTLRPDVGPGAEPITYTMQCASCEAHGPDATDGGVGTAWAAQHLKTHPDHLTYWEHIKRPYRAEPGAWL